MNTSWSNMICAEENNWKVEGAIRGSWLKTLGVVFVEVLALFLRFVSVCV